MRRPLIAVLLIASCSDVPNQVAPDALAADGGRDGSGEMDGGIDAPPGPIDGTWHLEWTCTDNCHLPAAAVRHSGLLVIAGTELAWRDEDCVECVADHVGVLRGTCLDVAAHSDGLDHVAAYSACVAPNGTLVATIASSRIGGTGLSSVWQFVGSRY